MKKFRKIILFIFFITTIFGCKKHLVIPPTDIFDETKAYISIDDLQRGLNTAYARYTPESRIMPNSVVSDEAKFGPDNAGQYQFEYKFQFNADGTTSGTTTSSWYNMYSLIDQINRVLGVFPNIPATTPADILRKDVIKGQLLALRALGHFELLNAYSKKYDANDPLGVPLMTTSSLLGTPARSTVAQVVAGVEGDLTTARSLLSAPVAALFNDNFINQITVDGIRARVALYKRDWTAARDLANAVILTNVRPISTGANFNGIWTDANTNIEVLFRLKRGSASVGANYVTTGGAVYLSPSDKLNNLFAATDLRKAAYIATVGTKRVVNKFYGSLAGARINDMKEMRIAEMYLIRAEAKAELNDLAGATADINLIRTNRITGYVNVADFATQAIAVTEVMNERFKELCFEGFRFYDLKRKGLDVNRLASDVDSPNWLNLLSTNFRMQFPIPTSEIQANPNMIQNSNY